MAHLEVDLVAADRKVWSGEASMVSAPAADGGIGILPGHAPVLSVLRAGTVRVHPVSGAVQEIHVSGGFLSVDDDQVTVVVDTADVDPGTSGRPGAGTR